MKKLFKIILISLFLLGFTILTLDLLFLPVDAATPTRSYAYTTGTTIQSSHVTTNEDNIYTYLQNGIEAIKDNTIINADVNTSAAIDSSKLNLGGISQTVGISGDVTLSGTNTLSGANTISGATTITTGIVTTIDVAAGELDNVILGAATPNKIFGTVIEASSSYKAASGATINEFSTDGTMGGNSDTAVPTEKAVKTYADTKTVSQSNNTGDNVASGNGSYADIISQAKTITSGKTVFVIATGVIRPTAGNQGYTSVKIIHGSTDIQEFIDIKDSATTTYDTPFALQGVVTSLSGATTFKLQAAYNSSFQATKIYDAKLTIIEF